MAKRLELSKGQQRRKEERDKRRERNSAHGHIYFIQSADTHYIKIGYSVELDRRLKEISLHHTGVRLLGSYYCRGPRRFEELIHTLFGDLRVRGEWFRPNGRIFDFLQAHDDIKRVSLDSWAYHYVKGMTVRERKAALNAYGSAKEVRNKALDCLMEESLRQGFPEGNALDNPANTQKSSESLEIRESHAIPHTRGKLSRAIGYEAQRRRLRKSTQSPRLSKPRLKTSPKTP